MLRKAATLCVGLSSVAVAPRLKTPLRVMANICAVGREATTARLSRFSSVNDVGTCFLADVAR